MSQTHSAVAKEQSRFLFWAPFLETAKNLLVLATILALYESLAYFGAFAAVIQGLFAVGCAAMTISSWLAIQGSHERQGYFFAIPFLSFFALKVALSFFPVTAWYALMIAPWFSLTGFALNAALGLCAVLFIFEGHPLMKMLLDGWSSLRLENQSQNRLLQAVKKLIDTSANAQPLWAQLASVLLVAGLSQQILVWLLSASVGASAVLALTGIVLWSMKALTSFISGQTASFHLLWVAGATVSLQILAWAWQGPFMIATMPAVSMLLLPGLWLVSALPSLLQGGSVLLGHPEHMMTLSQRARQLPWVLQHRYHMNLQNAEASAAIQPFAVFANPEQTQGLTLGLTGMFLIASCSMISFFPSLVTMMGINTVVMLSATTAFSAVSFLKEFTRVHSSTWAICMRMIQNFQQQEAQAKQKGADIEKKPSTAAAVNFSQSAQAQNEAGAASGDTAAQAAAAGQASSSASGRRHSR